MTKIYVQVVGRKYDDARIAEILDNQEDILELLRKIHQQGVTMAGEVAKLEQDVAENASVIQSAITLLNNIKALLDAAGTDPVKLAALSTALEANSAALAAAVVANTPSGGAGPTPDPNS